jgi:hypothetical protein
MDLASRKGFLADSGTKLMKAFWGLTLLAIVVPHANADGICVNVGSSLYGTGTLATAPSPFIAGCTPGLSNNTGTGGVVTTTPSSLPSPLSLLTSATINFSDPTTTNSLASASLGLGTLGAYAFGSAGSDGSFASSALNDTVHFHISDASSAPITVNVHVNGTESGTGTFNNTFSLTSVGVLGFQMDNAGFAITSNPGWGTFTNTSQGGFNYSGTITVTNGEALGITAALSLACVTSETCDFSHTAALSFNLPSDVTFTSDSGVFLTQTAAPAGAPEPASLALMGAGLVALGVFRKKRIRPGRSGN